MQDKQRRRGDGLSVARVEAACGGVSGYAFVHPKCARKRREDMEEVLAMVEGGEADIAREELVWLLSECPDFLDAHLQLGLLALADDDAKLARGHFGRVYELGLRAVEAAGNPAPLPYAIRENESFWQAAKGLVHCLVRTGRRGMAKGVVEKLARLDPSDPLGLKLVLDSKEGPSHG
jgi:hypothetical protein